MKKEIGLLSLLDYGKDSRPLIFSGPVGAPDDTPIARDGTY
jgi:hypothetical protein